MWEHIVHISIFVLLSSLIQDKVVQELHQEQRSATKPKGF